MKKGIVAVLLFATIISVGIYENIYFNQTMDSLELSCNQLEILIEDEILTDGISLCENMATYWENQNTFLEIVAYNPNVKNVSLDILEILGALKADDAKSAMARLYVLRQRITELRETMGFSAISVI